LIRPIAAAGLAAGLGVGVATTSIAQDASTPTAGSINLANSVVALHDGSCANPELEPEFEIGSLEREEWYVDDDGLIDQDEGIPAGIGVGDVDDDGIYDMDEEGFVTEDLDDDGVLDDDEDLNDNDVLDAGIDEDGDGVLDDDEVIADYSPAIGPVGFTTVWQVDEEVDATFEEIFGVEEDDAEEEDDDSLNNPGVIAVHESQDNYANIVACAEMSVPTDWEDRDTVVLGLAPAGDSNFYGYAVFERDTGNIPVFGDNTTGVTVYLFENLPTSRDNQAMESTPES